jgi:signal transduction histidine kinase
MGTLLYIHLIGFTAGTLLMLFWMVVILGYRRQRNFERVFFFLCLALFCFYGGSLLALNAQIYYSQPPPLLNTFAWTVLSAGLCFAPALLVHLHLEYASMRSLIVRRDGDVDRWKRLVLTFIYAFVILFAIRMYRNVVSVATFDFILPANAFGELFGGFLTSALGTSAAWQFKFANASPNGNERLFHRFAGIGLSLCTLLAALLHMIRLPLSPQVAAIATTCLSLLPVPLFAALIYAVQKYNFLQIGRQTNLMYAVSVTFLALLYLSLVRRISGLLEPMLPPEATASILLFVLVVFVEPMQRVLARRLHETAQHRMDDVRLLIAEIRKKAREGNLRNFVDFVVARVKEQFEFPEVSLEVDQLGRKGLLRDFEHSPGSEQFAIAQSGFPLGFLAVRPHGAILSGEIRAVLELLCEELPGAIELCRAIEEKVRLERELAERERLAALGQMAASISHNLKNPLGAIKTILQLQLENPEMPESLKSETTMVLSEVNRLSSKLNQLLQFSRAPILGQHVDPCCDVADILREVTDVLRPEADRRGVSLIVPNPPVPASQPLPVAIARDALNDILSNLLVNALDAVSSGGHITVTASQSNGLCSLTVEDDGPGIPSATQEKILQPFFTTKPQGTGLGLAIVARRVADAGGRLDWQSPVANSRGTRFCVHLSAGPGLGSKLTP